MVPEQGGLRSARRQNKPGLRHSARIEGEAPPNGIDFFHGNLSLLQEVSGTLLQDPAARVKDIFRGKESRKRYFSRSRRNSTASLESDACILERMT
jgi:hypothetical protein